MSRLKPFLYALLSVMLISSNAPAALAQSSAQQPATEATARQQQMLRDTLPFADQRDFEESQRGFIAAPGYRQILGAAGNVV